MKQRSFFPLFATNFFGVVNDNFLKTLAGFVVLAWLGEEKKDLHAVFMGGTAAALVLPYILCSPLADRLTAVYEKRRIFRFAKIAEIPIVLIGIVGFFLRSIPLVIVAILLMGLQSSLYSPAKYALVRDVGGEDRISTGMGGMEGVAFAAVLAGTVIASFAADLAGPWAWAAALVGFALLGLVFSCTIRADETKNAHIHAINPVRYMKRAYRMARRYDGLNAVIVTLSAFWFVAAMLQQGLVVYGTQVLRLDSVRTGGILALAAVGIVAGQVLAGFVDRVRPLIGCVLATGWIASALLVALGFVTRDAAVFSAAVALLAFDLGFFKLPLDAEIQRVAKGPKLNTMLAYFNQVSFLFMFAASVCYIAVSALFGPRAFLFLGAVAMFVAPLLFAFAYRKALFAAGTWALARRYDVRVDGMDAAAKAAADGAALLVLPNHPAMVDPMIVSTAFRDTPLRPLCDEAFFKAGLVAPLVLKTIGAIPVPDLRRHRTAQGAKMAQGLGGLVTGALAAGQNVIFYPSGHIQTEENREDIGTRQLAYNICRELPKNARVIGVRTRGLWGSVWSRKGRKSSPAFVPTFVRSVLTWLFLVPFLKRRRVEMRVEDLTDRATAWAASGTRLEFNAKLGEWYNA